MGELWSPTWSIRTMLTSIQAFMVTPAKGIGAISVDKKQRKKYALQSQHYSCDKCNAIMSEIVWPKVECHEAPSNVGKASDDDDDKQQTSEEQSAESKSTTTTTTTATVSDDNQEQIELKEEDANTNEEQVQVQVADQMNGNGIIIEEAPRTSSTSSSVRVSATQTQTPNDIWLDSLTVLVFIAIAIFVKKFAVAVIDQL